VDTFASTRRLLVSLGCRNPLMFLSRFALDDVVFWLDQVVGEMMKGARVRNPPGYLWSLLMAAEQLEKEAPHDDD